MKNRILLRPYLVIAALVFQLAVLFICIEYFSAQIPFVGFLLQLVSVVALLYILNRPGNAAFKMPWILLILTAPVLGGVIYFLTAGERVSNSQTAAYCKAEHHAQSCTAEKLDTKLEELRMRAPSYAGQFSYLERKGFPVYENTQCKYYPLADTAFPEMLDALKKAKHYIFLEYFIINRSGMWAEILNILERKVHDGVEVRVLYDDIATMTLLPYDYPRLLAQRGIQCIEHPAHRKMHKGKKDSLCYQFLVSKNEYEEIQKAIEECALQKDSLCYNFAGAICSILHIYSPFKKRGQYFCSEFVSERLLTVCDVKLRRSPRMYFPNNLAKALCCQPNLYRALLNEI